MSSVTTNYDVTADDAATGNVKLMKKTQLMMLLVVLQLMMLLLMLLLVILQDDDDVTTDDNTAADDYADDDRIGRMALLMAFILKGCPPCQSKTLIISDTLKTLLVFPSSNCSTPSYSSLPHSPLLLL